MVVAMQFENVFKLRGSDTGYAAPTELAVYGRAFSTKMTRRRRSTARLAQISGKK
jgi:hypothetical protein